MIISVDREPLDERGRLITDPATVIAVREDTPLNQEQADAMRRRVAEVRASCQRYADQWGVTVAAVARIRLAVIAAEREARRIQRSNGSNSTQALKIIRHRIGLDVDGGRWLPL